MNRRGLEDPAWSDADIVGAVTASIEPHTEQVPTPTEAGGAGAHRDNPGQTRIFQRLDTCAAFPYRRDEYLRRALWVVVSRLLFHPTPNRLLAWRRWLLRRFGAKIAPTVNIRSSARIRHPWLLEMGAYSTLADHVEVYNLGPLKIGDHTVVSQNSHLCNGTHDYRDPSLPLTRPEMTIGSGVWICADAFIGPGVTIGDNTLVGARAVVTRDLPAGVIAAGNPARALKDRPMDFAKYPSGGDAGGA